MMLYFPNKEQMGPRIREWKEKWPHLWSFLMTLCFCPHNSGPYNAPCPGSQRGHMFSKGHCQCLTEWYTAAMWPFWVLYVQGPRNHFLGRNNWLWSSGGNGATFNALGAGGEYMCNSGYPRWHLLISPYPRGTVDGTSTPGQEGHGGTQALAMRVWFTPLGKSLMLAEG